MNMQTRHTPSTSPSRSPHPIMEGEAAPNGHHALGRVARLCDVLSLFAYAHSTTFWQCKIGIKGTHVPILNHPMWVSLVGACGFLFCIKASSDIPMAFSDRPFIFAFPKPQSEPWKVLCYPPALSTLWTSCFRSRTIFPEVAVALYSELEPSKATQIRLRERCSLFAFSKRDTSTIFNMHWSVIKCGIWEGT